MPSRGVLVFFVVIMVAVGAGACISASDTTGVPPGISNSGKTNSTSPSTTESVAVTVSGSGPPPEGYVYFRVIGVTNSTG